jgi:CBS domain-containing protein
MLIRDVLTVKGNTANITVEPDALITEAVKQMVEHGIGSLLVMQGDNLVGFITERIVLRGMHERGCSLIEVKVSELMDQEPVVGTLDDSVDYARDVMTKNHINHLIVLDDGKLAGVISFHDLAKACLKDASFENELLKRYIKNWPE